MLSPKTQTNLKNAKGYFEEHLCAGEYYAEDGRVLGQWMGQGAQRLGLSGVAQRDAFLALCENQHPFTNERLTQRLNMSRRDAAAESVANRRVFYDFTFSPPKSVSVAALVGNDRRIVNAHEAAVKGALSELENFAATRVRDAKGNGDRRTGNVVAALFNHQTSRALDPHLHTHCIVFNATYDAAEQQWKALQNYDMLRAQKYAENVYYHELARSLHQFGYTVVNKSRGDFELAEVSPELCKRFSKRHDEIDEKTRAFMAAHAEKAGVNRNAIREHIAHQDRGKKQPGLSDLELEKHWAGQLTPEEHRALKKPGAESMTRQCVVSAAEAVTWAENHLFERRSVVREHELWRHALEIARGSALLASEVKHETAARDYVRSDGDRIAHRAVLATEWAIVEAARAGMGQCSPMVSGVTESDARLAPDQLRALQFILGSTDFITLFRGGAGTGKSFVLQRVQNAFNQAGLESLVLAPQRQQAIDLDRDGLRNAQTVSECLQRQSIPRGAVVIVDEAGQIGGRQLLDLIRLVQQHNGRLLLSGDTRQHGPVEASDALRAIERYSGLRWAALDEIRRQDPARGRTVTERKQIQAYREAVESAANGELEASYQKLDALGAIVECPPHEQGARLVQEYLELSARGESAIVVSQTRAEVCRLNEGIRASLRERGIIAGVGTEITALEQIDLSEAQKRDLRYYPEDAVVVCNRGYRGWAPGEQGYVVGATKSALVVEVAGKPRRIPKRCLDRVTVCIARPMLLSAGDQIQLKANGACADGRKFANGEVVTITAVEPDGSIALKDGRLLPVVFRQFNRGYAVTSYGSQGKTVDHVLFADSAVRAASNAQQWYVSISRGRKSIKIYTQNKGELADAIARSGERELALDLVPLPSRRKSWRQTLLKSMGRGRDFARHVCQRAMRQWTSAFTKSQTISKNETSPRPQQTERFSRANVLAP